MIRDMRTRRKVEEEEDESSMGCASMELDTTLKMTKPSGCRGSMCVGRCGGPRSFII